MNKADLTSSTLPFDPGPLSWVMGEIREALARSRTALFEAGGRDPEDQATALQHARTHLHQAHGALQMVDVDGVALVTEAAELALERFKNGTLKANADNAQIVANLYQALVEYLQELLAGAPFQPVRLFPYYRDVQLMLGAERVHPADLFFPDLDQVPELPAVPGAPSADYAALRQRFERALLPYLRAADAAAQAAAAAVLRDAIQAVADAQADARGRAFWRSMQVFAELVAAGQVESGLYVKQIFGMVNLQLRRLSQGAPELPEALQRDALFFIAAADPAVLSPLGVQLRSAYGLDGMVPQDYEARRYGQLDEAALARANEALAQARAAWQRIEQAESDAEQTASFTRSLAALAVASEKLGLAPLAALMRQLAAVAETTSDGGRSEALGLEMAGALLFAEYHLAHIRRLPDDFTAHADTLGARLQALSAGETPPAPSDWQAGLVQQDDTVPALAAEMKTALRQVEKVLDEFHADQTRQAELSGLDPVLHQLEGALAVLDQPDAEQAASHVRAAVAALAAGGDAARGLDAIAQNVGALGFFVDMLGQNAAGARERFVFDADEGAFRAVPFRKMSGPESIPVLDQEVPSPPPPAPQLPAADAAAEAELLEIFIAEAHDVLASIRAQLDGPRAALQTMEGLAVLRRSFHTLKGSARMVGMTEYADAAAALERVMNLWLAEERAASNDLLALADWAARELGGWVEDLASSGSSARQAAPLVPAAETVRRGEAFALPEAGAGKQPEDVHTAGAPAMAGGQGEAEEHGEGWAQESVADDAERAAHNQDAARASAHGAAGESDGADGGNVVGQQVPTAPAHGAPPEEDNVKFVGRLAIPLPLYNIYLGEADELVRTLTRDFGEWRHEPRRPVSPDALQAAHRLAGSSGTVGFKPLRELAYALENALDVVQTPAPQLDPAQHDLLDFTMARIRQMLDSFATGAMPGEQPELIAALESMRAELAQPRADGALNARLDSMFADAASEAVVPPPPADDLAARLDALFADTYHALLADPPPLPARGAELRPRPQMAKQNESIDELFDAAFDDAFAAPPLAQVAPPPLPPAPEPLFPAPQAAAYPVPAAEEAPDAPEAPPAPDAVPAIVDELMSLPASIPADSEADLAQAPELEPVAETPGEAAASDAAVPVEAAADEPQVELVELPPAEGVLTETIAAAIADDIDPDLLPVFLEEGADLLPQVGEALRAWHNNPADVAHAHTLQRVLHTLKGSARMAGALRLGQHAHEIETHVESMVHAGAMPPQAFDELMAHYDHALLLFEQLQHPPAEPPQEESQQAPEQNDPAARQALVRVRADLLDRLVNQAGEVSITRSRLENEVGVLRTSLADFQDNLERLRRHLREVEMQAETQIASRLSIAGEREFDPLEFDRFTRLQELTRMMAESVNDVSAFHESLIRSVDAASDDLTQQARMTRDLQRDLMRVRMVPFASISERLFRVARQTAKEVDKRVNVDIRGGAVEMDRGVLERMAGPFEHLLRNAIVHGIEARAERAAQGKQETGELLVEVSQQGNEVVLEFSDDGAGLDLERIRARAKESGLLPGDAELNDDDAAKLIFEPGFSTADSLTELAGRGVGMDIVRAEANALGGRVEIRTAQGQGARFTIHLPLTLAVTQVVLLAAGGKTYAVPASLVEQVLQMKEGALAETRAAGALTLQGQSAPLHYLPSLLGDQAARPLAQRSTPVLLLRSGAERLALHADEILGNREAVIKNIGPQLSRVPGIAGATVLGNGDIVLILNPIVLAQQPGRVLPQVPAPARPEGVIMVVDDSITVRKVTQRLLEREGYTVMLAKDGVDALEQMQDRKPDLMLVDIEMPRMDGFDLTRNVRGDEATRAIPIIMITSRSADKHRNHALQLGVNAYFGKPYQEPILLGAIAGLMPKQP